MRLTALILGFLVMLTGAAQAQLGDGTVPRTVWQYDFPAEQPAGWKPPKSPAFFSVLDYQRSHPDLFIWELTEKIRGGKTDKYWADYLSENGGPMNAGLMLTIQQSRIRTQPFSVKGFIATATAVADGLAARNYPIDSADMRIGMLTEERWPEFQKYLKERHAARKTDWEVGGPISGACESFQGTRENEMCIQIHYRRTAFLNAGPTANLLDYVELIQINDLSRTVRGIFIPFCDAPENAKTLFCTSGNQNMFALRRAYQNSKF
ncbi:hypothetical protein ACFSM5_15710 [Lacibacterium aquatile]|uniref:Uncharacterized protein n=1 Tax=Lacibacterium aquatile TaxID=1168082 RepID=A0ABW5DU28_9PROT